MKNNIVLFSIVMALNLTACATAENQKDRAQAEYTEEKTETLQEYKECIKNTQGAEDKMKACEALLKAVEAVEGGK